MNEQTAVIVGAGSGLGRSLARAFVGHGIQVALIARNPERLTALAEEVGAYPAPGDVADPESLRAAFDVVRDRIGDPDVLIYNPSLWVEGPPSAMSYDEFTAGLAVGVSGLLVAAQEVLPAMRRAGAGTILVTGSGAALASSAVAAGLSAQKAALRMLALGLHDELQGEGINVSIVTIKGVITAGTQFDPDRIAARFWDVYDAPREQWRAEVVYAPDTDK